MNKLLTKIAGLTLGLTMAIGVGVATFATADEPVGVHAASTTVTMDIFANKGTTGTNTISWTKDGVTFKNNKASSSTAIRTSDSNHYRIYANSQIVISADGGNISQVVFTTTGTDYATVMENSAKTIGGISKNNLVITLTPTTPAVELTFSVTAQTRVKQVSVTYSSGGGSTAETVLKDDELTRSTTGNTGTSYANWSGKKETSDAVYAGNSAGGNTSIQLRSTNPSGIVSTTSGGTVRKVVVVWNSNTTSGRTLDIYGKTAAYSSSADLYSTTASILGTKLGSIKCGTSTELTISGDYTYIGLRSSSGAMYLTSITITWQTEVAEEKVATKLSASFKEGKGTYFNSDKNNQFSTQDLNVSAVTDKDELVTNYDNGIGYKVTLNGTTLDATTSVQIKSFASATAGSYTLTISKEGLTSATLTLVVANREITSIQWNNEQTDSYVSYIDSFKIDGTLSVKFNDGSASVQNQNIVTNIYDGNNTTGNLVGSVTKANTSYSNGFNLTTNEGISTDDSIHKRIAYSTSKTFYVEMYLESYPTLKIGKVVNITMPTLVVEDANEFNYYVGTEYEIAANAKLVSGTKERTLKEEEYSLNPETVAPANTDDITITVTFNECDSLTGSYIISPIQPATLEILELYDQDGNVLDSGNNSVIFTAGDPFGLFESNEGGYFGLAMDSDLEYIEISVYDDFTFVLADDAEGTNSTQLNVGDAIFLGMDSKFVIATYTQGSSSVSYAYEILVVETQVIEYQAPTTGGNIEKTTEIAVGDIVYLVSEDAGMELSSISTYGVGVELTADGVLELEIEEGSIDGTVAFKFTEESSVKYLNYATGNSLSSTSSITNTSSWYVSFDDSGNAIIENSQYTSTSTEPRRLAWNIRSPRFANYKISSLNNDFYSIQLYKGSAKAGNTAEYLISVIDTYRLNSAAKNDKYGLSICDADSGIYSYENWSLVKELYQGLVEVGDTAKLNVQDKYGADETTYLETYRYLIEHESALSASKTLGLTFLNQDNGNVEVVIVAASCLLFFGVFLVIRKKKEIQQ